MNKKETIDALKKLRNEILMKDQSLFSTNSVNTIDSAIWIIQDSHSADYIHEIDPIENSVL